jgi:heterodisulfide reductase subunit A
LVECGRHLNVELLTLSEVVDVKGQAGAFTVTVRQRPRYIDMDKCIACGVCAEKCPKIVQDEFNAGTAKRKAAYIPYGQSVPLKYAIDPEACLFLTRGKCRACAKFCPTKAIHFEDKEKIHSLNVGAVVLAPGFTPFDPAPFCFYGYGQIADVVTSLEYERLLSAGGPCMGHLVRPSDQRPPRRIAWIQCVGSRNTNGCNNGFCSSVCCMYAIKQSLVTAEHVSGQDLAQTIFYMDIRSPGKEFERYYNDAKAKGVAFVHARPHTIEPGAGDAGVTMRYTTDDGRTHVASFDMAVLSVGLTPPADAAVLGKRFAIALDRHGFALTDSFSPVASSRPGVFLAGAFLGPKAIPRSVTEASAAAAAAAAMLADSRGTLTRAKTYPPEIIFPDPAPRIGVFVCSCGINIAGVVDVKAVMDHAKDLPHVVYVENNLFTCSADTQGLIAKKIAEHHLNRIVIAACTPRTHEPLFQDTLREAGLNAYLVEMANIRNQNSWVHQKEPGRATEKAQAQVAMAVAKAALNQPLERLSVDVEPRALVIGGGVAGMHAALSLAEQHFDTVLLEKTAQLGGNAWHLNTTSKGQAIQPMLAELMGRVESHPRITVFKQARLTSAMGSVGKFVSKIQVGDQTRALTYGVAVLATGARETRPDEYLYGDHPGVMTHLDFDAAVRDNPEAVTAADSIVFIQCVGSREPRRPYCSRLCCIHSVKSAIELKKRNPALNISILHREMRTYGKSEELYETARRLGVIFIRYTLDSKPRVSVADNEICVDVFDPISQRPLRITGNYLVLAAAIEPNTTTELVELFKCGQNADGFLNEAHPKLRPVDMAVDGLFVAGMCNYPKPMDEAIAQAQAAAARAAGVLARPRMDLDGIKSHVTENCDGCALCLDVCPFKAIKLESYAGTDGRGHKRIVTDKALCKGCGLCAATCPKAGVIVQGFTLEQLKAQVAAALA